MRPNKDTYFMYGAHWASLRSTCIRRPVGAVLVNGLGHVVGTGYNGRPAGYEHCNHVQDFAYTNQRTWNEAFENDLKAGLNPIQMPPKSNSGPYVLRIHPHACRDAFAPQGTKPQGCEAIHAEQNALLQCYDVLWVDTAYVTRSPCIPCTKLLLNTACRRIVFGTRSSDHDTARELWTRNNTRLNELNPLVRKVREWVHLPVDNPFQDK